MDMWVKICGITNRTDALAAVAMGADAVGFVLAPSPRQLTPAAVREITRALPHEVMSVGVFRDHPAEQVVDMALEAGVRAVQLHGHESPADVEVISPKVSAVIVAMTAGSARVARIGDYAADALLLDAPKPGSGEVFDWALAAQVPADQRLILAGGLTSANVADAVTRLRPWGVDVSSGVERAPGEKDIRLVRAFIAAARRSEREVATSLAGQPEGADSDGRASDVTDLGWAAED